MLQSLFISIFLELTSIQVELNARGRHLVINISSLGHGSVMYSSSNGTISLSEVDKRAFEETLKPMKKIPERTIGLVFV